MSPPFRCFRCYLQGICSQTHSAQRLRAGKDAHKCDFFPVMALASAPSQIPLSRAKQSSPRPAALDLSFPDPAIAQPEPKDDLVVTRSPGPNGLAVTIKGRER